MPDITMCGNRHCDRRASCFRYVAKPSRLQSYARFGDKLPCPEFADKLDSLWVRDVAEVDAEWTGYVYAPYVPIKPEVLEDKCNGCCCGSCGRNV